MVHPGGRPRTTCLPPDEMEELGKEMLKWVIDNNPIHLKQWYSFVKHFTYNEWKSMIQKAEFIPYYEEAIGRVGINYINGNIDKSIAQRFIRLYYKDVKEEENETALYNSQLSKEANSQGTEEQIAKLQAMIDLMRENQSNAKASNSNNTDNKS